MGSNNAIVGKASEYVSTLFKDKLPAWATYHSYDHTVEVVRACEEIADGSKLSKLDTEVVLLAAWFHDTGYTETANGHEEMSVDIARRFLNENGYPQEKIDRVAACIRATELSHQPNNLLEEVLRDADTAHTGKKSFFQKSDLLRMELERQNGKPYADLEWLNINVDFISRNQFRTKYAKAQLGKRRTKNLIALQEQVREAVADQGENKAKAKLKEEKVSKKLEMDKIPIRGIETMFRVVPSNHLNLSSIADGKASLMLTTNSIIISIVVGTLMSKLETNPWLQIPTFILLGVCMTAIVFAILATRPKVTTGTFTREEIRQKKVNLLFFGNFHGVPLEDFEWGMKEMMNDREYLYGSMIKDLYFLGKVLERKYRYLRLCYIVFMYGLIASIIAFGITFIFFLPPTVS
jgi:putative nucleotidyltransferase with HDIG domain